MSAGLDIEQATLEAPLAPWLEEGFARLLAKRGHAWLVTGAAGLGQFELVMAMAASSLCESPSAQGGSKALQHMACGHCAACLMVRAKSHPDLAMLLPETLALELGWPLDEKAQKEIDEKKRKASKQIKIEAIRDLVQFVQRTSGRGQGLVTVIYPADAMNSFAATALLKTLEEPAGHTRFFLATQGGSVLLPTIRSRCQHVALTLPQSTAALAWLVSQGMLAADADIWLKAAGGQPHTALVMKKSLSKVSAWQDLPSQIIRGAAPAELPQALVEKPAALVGALQKLCHDAICISQGSEPRFFPHFESQASLYQLSTWAKALNAHARAAEHTLGAALMIEAVLAQAKQTLGK